MRNDIVDGAIWAIKNKIADKDKIAIMGASWGGYSTLAGLVFTPDMFCCGVDVFGVSNLVTFWETAPPYWESSQDIFFKLTGDIRTQKGRESAIKNSPMTYIANIKKPLIIFHGKNDARVNQKESDQVVSIMKKKGLPVTYVLYPDEGHGFLKEQNMKSHVAIVEKFLAKIMGGRFEPIHPGELTGSSHQILEGRELLELNNSAI
jgi:dipeptidyl aminopeptidase/acylaminoacyl peptidase